MPVYRVTLYNGKKYDVQAASAGEARDRISGRLHGKVIQTEREYGSNSRQAKKARQEYKSSEPAKVEEKK